MGRITHGRRGVQQLEVDPDQLTFAHDQVGRLEVTMVTRPGYWLRGKQWNGGAEQGQRAAG
jgi:hypothetical protein